MRLVNGLLLYFGLISDWTIEDVICHALVLSVVISDMIVSKMAKRELHPIIVIGSMLTMFNHNLFTFVLVGCYFLKMFYEICHSMNLFLFNPSINVYICGVFDLTHAGHMEHFSLVSLFGNRLIVGVHSSADVECYKRDPTMTTLERCKTVGMCRSVSEVIVGAPLRITKKFIEDHNIHIVVCSDEYDTEDDEYYAVPREMGILKIVPRVKGVSTSTIRNRVYESVKKQLK